MSIQVHVTYDHAALQWVVKATDSQVAYRRTAHKDEAVAAGIQLAKNKRAELVVHRMDGTIEYRNSYGNDPYPPRG